VSYLAVYPIETPSFATSFGSPTATAPAAMLGSILIKTTASTPKIAPSRMCTPLVPQFAVSFLYDKAAMSAIGPKRTLRDGGLESAFGSKADIANKRCHVR